MRVVATKFTSARALAGVLALTALACWTPGAQATVRAGAAGDPSGDLAPADAPSLPNPPLDFTNAGVRYDDATGRVDVSFKLTAAPPASHGVTASVGLGVPDGAGGCNAPSYTRWWKVASGKEAGQAAIYGFWSASGSGPVQPTSSHEVVGEVIESPSSTMWHDLDPLSDWDGGAKQSWNFSTVNAALRGRDYICAQASLKVEGPGGQGEDLGVVFDLKPVSTPPGGGGPADHAPPRADVGGEKTQGLDRAVEVSVRSISEDLWASGTGTVVIPGAAKSYRLKAVRNVFVARGSSAELKLALTRRARRAIRRALRRGRKAKAKVTVRVRDAAGNSTTKTRVIKLTR